MGNPRAIRRRLLAFALKLPGAYLDHPWGEDVAKVNKKVFAFLGTGDRADPAMSVKGIFRWRACSFSQDGLHLRIAAASSAV